MPKYVFDTNIFISKLVDRLQTYKTLYASSVVLHERMTASNDLKEFRSYQSSWQKAEKAGLLLTPNREDWLTASRIAYRLAIERKQQAGGKAPKLSTKLKQEIAMDL